ncbi:DUF4387 domain-containing protein [Dactylosporangium aurantiacum]|uniref:DUF4387 domain-containing protein n=1 Tax=Dactylosporangium aurantiacum TaxID=35754 RepID=A0A9Q9MIQ6_9ACTN|nr:DUF4387 domain-containing protein [Dactylosporangium aurantiacum]MDG6106329.1 DUF4387 domain-containing protein [Dactylosporangium aurantiacum]UWZ58179.1 DUF4387 domain-containing protein [Dactylosporangium aurantiacum]
MTASPAPRTVADLALEVRSKNAGPFWVTMELFMRDAAGYALVADPAFLDEHVVARLYDVDAGTVQLFRLPDLNVVKISFPRPVPQGSLRDRDIHAGQHHVPLALLPLPVAAPTVTSRRG